MKSYDPAYSTPIPNELLDRLGETYDKYAAEIWFNNAPTAETVGTVMSLLGSAAYDVLQVAADGGVPGP